MIVLGIDPSLRCTGCAVVDGQDVLAFTAIGRRDKAHLADKLHVIRAKLLEFIPPAIPLRRGADPPCGMTVGGVAISDPPTPDIVAIEVASGRVDPKKGGGVNLTKYAMAVGVAIGAAMERGYTEHRLRLIADTRWTRSWSGRGGGTERKARRAELIRSALRGLPPHSRDTGNDVADAAGLAWWVAAEGVTIQSHEALDADLAKSDGRTGRGGRRGADWLPGGER